jgi:hypothetical protein
VPDCAALTVLHRSGDLNVRLTSDVEGGLADSADFPVRNDVREEILMAQFLLSVWHGDGYPSPPPEVMEQMFGAVAAFNDELIEAGAMVFAGGLLPKATATVAAADTQGNVTLGEGPFATGPEQMGGFWVIDTADLDAALDWATKGAAACFGSVEVRAFQGE